VGVRQEPVEKREARPEERERRLLETGAVERLEARKLEELADQRLALERRAE
jgi:hypothetical protein